MNASTCPTGHGIGNAGKASDLALRRAGRTRGRARDLASGDERVVEDKGGARRENLLAELNRVRRVENIREGTRETDSAHDTTPVMKRPRRFGQLPESRRADTC
jgi:hypothetical protein